MPPAKRSRSRLKYCSYETCSNNSGNTNINNVRFIPYPKPTTPIGLERAKKWIINCNRKGMALENINENKYVCSQHFVDPRGPTNTNPDPVPADTTICQSTMRLKKAELVCNKKWLSKLHMVQDTARENKGGHDHPRHDSNAVLLCEIQMEDGDVGTTKSVAQDNVSANAEKQAEHQPAIISTLHEVMLHCKGWYMKYEVGNESQITASFVKWAECGTLLTVTVVAKHKTLHTSLMVGTVQVDANHPLWGETAVENLLGMRNLLDNLSTWNICIHLRSQTNHSTNPTTCKALVQPPSVICTECKTKFETLAANSKSSEKPLATPQSVLRLQHRHMDKQSLCLKINYLTKRNVCYRKQITRLKSQLNAIIVAHREQTLQEEANKDFLPVLEEHVKGTTDKHGIFLQEQLKIVKENGKCNQHKWHPLVIKWCINMMKSSLKGYKSLRNSGFVKLPSERTLRRHYDITAKGPNVK